MTSDRDALYRAICLHPDEDTPRLAFADAVEEDGEAESAEFIRSQVEFARLEEDGSDSQAVYEFLREKDKETLAAVDWPRVDPGLARRAELDRRIGKLWRQHGQAWARGLPRQCGVTWGEFRRGLVAAARLLSGRTLARSAARVMRSAPPVVMRCPTLTARTAEALVEAGLLRWITGLQLDGNWAAGLRVIGRHPDAANVQSITVCTSLGGSGGARFAEAIAGSPHWTGLRHLDLRGLWLEPTPAKDLFQADHLRGLTRLRIRGPDWSGDTTLALAAARFSELFELRLTGANLSDADAEVLAECPSLGQLRYLDLGHNQITGRGASAILTSRHLAGLAVVSFVGNPVRGLDTKALANTSPGGLRLFHGHGCRMTAADVRALTRSPRLDDLWYLDLDENALTDTAVREVLRGLGRRCPPVLWMIGNRIGADGAKQIAAWPHASRLQLLLLHDGNRLTNAGVRALLASPHLANLGGLTVSGVTERVARAVRDRFGDQTRTASEPGA
jgi:uncharacterized protein (TIGR02996 family)